MEKHWKPLKAIENHGKTTDKPLKTAENHQTNYEKAIAKKH